MHNDRYRKYSAYLREKYGGKVYKLPINLPITCPNRDGTVGRGGCTFCGEEGAGFESMPSSMPVNEQLKKNMQYIKDKYKADKFIAYFQNYTNTYMQPQRLKEYVQEACLEDIVEIYISTRPDCVADRHLEAVGWVARNRGVGVTFELGLQTVNYHSLIKVNRGHTLGEFIDAVLKIKRAGFDVCVHIILDLPWDNRVDAVENAKIISALGADQVKLHSLYIVKGTPMAESYLKGELQLVSMEEYVERVIMFLEHLDPGIVIQRLIGRAPEENTITANWNTSWWKVRDLIEEEMVKRDTWQGKNFNYLGGKGVSRFL